MATIGYVHYNADRNEYVGTLKTMRIVGKLRFSAVEKRTERSPDYRIFAENGAECGAAWIRISQEGNDYVSLVIDDPSLPQPIRANLGRADGQDDEGVFAIIWNRA